MRLQICALNVPFIQGSFEVDLTVSLENPTVTTLEVASGTSEGRIKTMHTIPQDLPDPCTLLKVGQKYLKYFLLFKIYSFFFFKFYDH